MPWTTIVDAFKSGALDGGLAKLNVGTTDSGADMRLLAAAGGELAASLLSNPAFAPATVNGGVAVANANAMTDDSTITVGTFVGIQFRDRDNSIVLAGDIGLIGSGAAVEVPDNVITSEVAQVDFEGFAFALAFAP